MKSFLITLPLFFSVAYGSDRAVAYKLICRPMAFKSERYNCLSKISRYSYFDKKALGICSSMPFNSEKLSCLGTIGDKGYEDYEMHICTDEIFSSEKMKCLRLTGAVYHPKNPSCHLTDESSDQFSDCDDKFL